MGGKGGKGKMFCDVWFKIWKIIFKFEHFGLTLGDFLENEIGLRGRER